MKETLSTSQAADILRSDEYGGWTYAGAYAMVEYLEQLEDDLGEEIEMDRVAISCDYSEYPSLQEWHNDYFGGPNGEVDFSDCDGQDEKDEQIREYISDRGQLIEFDGGIIVSSF